MITGRTAGEYLGALEDVLHAVRRVDDIVVGEVVPHVAVLVVPSYENAKPCVSCRTILRLH
jgi:hypothetical protein